MLWWHYLRMHPRVPAPHPPRLWELVLLVGKPTPCAPRGPCSGYPSAKAAAGITQVLVPLHEGPPRWLCGDRDRCLSSGVPRMLDVKRLSPPSTAEPSSACESLPSSREPGQGMAGSHPRREEGAGLGVAPCTVLPSALCSSSFVSPGLLGDSHSSPLAGVTSDKPGYRRMSSSPAAGRESCS